MNNVNVKFPTDMKEADAIMIGGANSLLKNIPTPNVFIIDGHACISLKEKLQHLHAHGFNGNYMYNGTTGERNKEGLNGTKAADDLYAEIEQSMINAGIVI